MTSTLRITTTAAVILSLAAGGAPAAAARPAIDPPTAVNQTPSAVHSRPDKSVIPVSPPATNASASGRAAALRALSQQERQRVTALSAYREGQLAASLDVAATAANKTSASPAAVRVQTPQRSFDWGDAGIGAAGGLALATLGLGVGLATYHRRPRRARQSNPIPS
jgi:hypothetical protein